MAVLDLDLLLTVVGIVLAAIGVGVLLLGRSRTTDDGERRNVFEAFGIKLDVANPSVLLIMFGVVLMLTPRVLPLGQAPQLPGMPTGPAVAPPDPGAEQAPTEVVEVPMPAEPAAASEPKADVVAHQVAAAAAQARERELAELRAQRRAAALEKAALAEQRARLAALQREAAPALPAEPTASGTTPAPLAAERPRLVILTEALHYDGETDGSLRAKLHGELRDVARDILGQSVALDSSNPGFRKTLRLDDMSVLCKRTQADHLLLADLTPVAVESFTVESANWPNMRYSAVACDTGRIERSDEMRMEPAQGDSYPLQQSVARSAREFVRAQRHLLE